MIITKIFDIILNITNINDIFTKDINQKLLELLSLKYLNKCYMGCYINKIIKIINRSLLESNQNDLNCSFIVSIQFEAECILYNKGEVILNMEIQENINNNIITKKDNILAIIKNNSDTVNFKKDSKIPIIVGKAKYSLGSDKISINAYPFIPLIFNNVYYKINKISEIDKENLQENIIKYIEIEEENKKKILNTKNNTWEYFKNLIYPFNENNSEKIIKNENTLDLLSLFSSKTENIIIGLNNKIDLSNRLICIYDEKKIDSYISNSTYLILFEIFKKYYLYLKLLNDLSIEYNSKELIEKNKIIFEIYTKYKK